MVAIRLVCSLWLLSIGGCVWANEERPVDDICLNAYSKGEYGTRDGYNLRVQEPNKHVSTRLMRYFWFGGVLQAISQQFRIPRDVLTGGERSQLLLLRSANRTRDELPEDIVNVAGIHWVVRAWDHIAFLALVNFINGSDNEFEGPSVWRDLHRQIDRYQGQKMSELDSIDFTGTLDKNNLRHVEDLISEFREVIDKYVHNDDAKAKDTKELEEELIAVFCISPSMLFEEGKTGYHMMKNRTFVERYGQGDIKENNTLMLH